VIEDRLTLNVEIAARLRDARFCAEKPRASLNERTAGQILASMISRFESAKRRLGIKEARFLALALGPVTQS
jgi:hypothetical protein